jgi:hypothetical protein
MEKPNFDKMEREALETAESYMRRGTNVVFDPQVSYKWERGDANLPLRTSAHAARVTIEAIYNRACEWIGEGFIREMRIKVRVVKY